MAVALILAGVACGGRVAEDGDTVLVHYHGTLDNGEVFDSSREGDAFQFVVGGGGVISGFDEAVRGLAAGESRTVRMEAADAYGEWREDRVVEVAVQNAPPDLQAGDRVSLGGQPAVIVEVRKDVVVVDANHPLAGEALTFEVELVSIE